MSADRPPPDWRPIALGIVIGLGAAGVIVGGLLDMGVFGGTGPGSSPAGSSPASPSAAAAGSSRSTSGAAASGSASSRSAVAGSALAGSALAGSALAATVDPTLLAILPASVGGLAVAEFPDAERTASADPNLARNVSRVATAFVGDPGGTNWAYAAVVDVRPEAETETFLRDWRDTFDESACARAGGVVGHATVVIGGRSVERASCGSSVRTYHVQITGTGLLVSISDLGDGRLGEQMVAGLRP